MALKLNTQFPDILIALNIQPHNILLLRAEHYRLCSWAWDCRNCIWIVYCVFIGWYFSKQDPLWSGTMQTLQTLQMLHFAYYVHALQEFIVLDYSIRLIYFHVCLPVFPPFVYNCCIMDRTYHSHKSCRSTLAPLRHHSSGMLTALFSSTCLPLPGHVECPC